MKWIFPAFNAVAYAGLVIIINFDGSLRPPRDPIAGFRHTSNVMQVDGPTKKPKLVDVGSTMAACSSTVSIQHAIDEEISLLAIGASLLPVTIGMTAADAEFQGLILGLKQLASAFVPVRKDDMMEFSLVSALNSSSTSCKNFTLIIRGDCKAIIDQLKSKSTPRKMRKNFETAKQLIGCIQKLSHECLQRDLFVCYEHVPREANILCDAICKLVINHKQHSAVRSIIDSEYPLDEILSNTDLCNSSRLALACMLTLTCIRPGSSSRSEHSLVLPVLSMYFMNLSRQWSKMYRGDGVLSDDKVEKVTLKEVSIACDKRAQLMQVDDADESHVQVLRDGVEFLCRKCTRYYIDPNKQHNHNCYCVEEISRTLLDSYVDGATSVMNGFEPVVRRRINDWYERYSDSCRTHRDITAECWRYEVLQ